MEVLGRIHYPSLTSTPHSSLSSCSLVYLATRGTNTFDALARWFDHTKAIAWRSSDFTLGLTEKYKRSIDWFVEFATSKRVRNLELDFNLPHQRRN
ncbi:unnamed protein product [Linum tenue]|uniref:Uncharacterized protein n=1 Tax=Linum tenue TaxID=586396 RepID=A0AAV0RTF2_9ROSI|nr:unnamed protein product [Linum tenue]